MKTIYVLESVEDVLNLISIERKEGSAFPSGSASIFETMNDDGLLERRVEVNSSNPMVEIQSNVVSDKIIKHALKALGIDFIQGHDKEE